MYRIFASALLVAVVSTGSIAQTTATEPSNHDAPNANVKTAPQSKTASGAISVRDASNLYGTLQSLSRPYPCDASPKTDAPKTTPPTAAACRYVFDGKISLMLARDLEKVRAIIVPAQLAVQSVRLTVFSAPSPTDKTQAAAFQTAQEARFEKEVAAIMDTTEPFDPEKIPTASLKIGSGPGENPIPIEDLANLAPIMQ